MSDPYLIAHKVRGEPAFDVAVRMVCRVCQEFGNDFGPGCHECDGLGYWWIIPTSGHRAYPFWSTELMATMEDHPQVGLEISWSKAGTPDTDYHRVGHLDHSWPDHYHHSTTPTTSLTERLGIGKTPAKPIDRRI